MIRGIWFPSAAGKGIRGGWIVDCCPRWVLLRGIGTNLSEQCGELAEQRIEAGPDRCVLDQKLLNDADLIWLDDSRSPGEKDRCGRNRAIGQDARKVARRGSRHAVSFLGNEVNPRSFRQPGI